MRLDVDPATMSMDLAARWVTLCERTGQADAQDELLRIRARYAEAGRFYHTLRHVERCLRLKDVLHSLAEAPDVFEFALWYHDLVYDSRRHDNEEASARAAAAFIGDPVDVRAVADLILATKHDAVPETPDARLICDMDLAILGAEPDLYGEYARAIRQEYAWVADADYATGRSRVLSAFLSRDAIFSTPACWERFESRARANIRQELSDLRGAG